MNVRERNFYHALYELAAEITSADSSEKILQSIVEGVCKTIKGKGASILLLAPDRKSLIHSIAYGLSQAFIEAGPRSLEKSLPETVIGKGQVATVYNIAQEKDRVQYPEIAIKEGLVSILAVPMKVRGDIIGELRLYTGEPTIFRDEDIYFIQAMANLGAIALDNRRLFDSCQRAYDSLANDYMNYRFSRIGQPDIPRIKKP
jgi:GAF domain-containing protein